MQALEIRLSDMVTWFLYLIGQKYGNYWYVIFSFVTNAVGFVTDAITN